MTLLGLTLAVFLLSLAVGEWAARWGRRRSRWFVWALLLSPPLAALVLMVLGPRQTGPRRTVPVATERPNDDG